MVVSQQASKPLAAYDRSVPSTGFRAGFQQAIPQALMIALVVVMHRVRLDGRQSAASLKKTIRSTHSDLIERTNRSAKALRFGLHAGRTQQSPHGLGVQWVTIHQDVPLAQEETIKGVQLIAEDLLHPVLSGVDRQPRKRHPSRGQLDNEQDDEPHQASRRHR